MLQPRIVKWLKGKKNTTAKIFTFWVFVLTRMNASNLKRLPHKEFTCIEESNKFFDYHEKFIFSLLQKDVEIKNQ